MLVVLKPLDNARNWLLFLGLNVSMIMVSGSECPVVSVPDESTGSPPLPGSSMGFGGGGGGIVPSPHDVNNPARTKKTNCKQTARHIITENIILVWPSGSPRRGRPDQIISY